MAGSSRDRSETPANADIPEATTAREILGDFADDGLDHVVTGHGPLGTIAGLARMLCREGSKTPIILAARKAMAGAGLRQKGDPFRMGLRALKAGIRADRDYGERPACVIATEGTSNTGSIAGLCPGEGQWLHVDGCVSALISITPDDLHPGGGIERAHSLALDLHKGRQAPFNIGCALVRDRSAPRLTFAEDAEDLQKMSRGIAAAEVLHRNYPDTTQSQGAEDLEDAEARWCGQDRTAD